MDKVFKDSKGNYTKIRLSQRDWLLIEGFMRDNHMPEGEGNALVLGLFLDFYKKNKQ